MFYFLFLLDSENMMVTFFVCVVSFSLSGLSCKTLAVYCVVVLTAGFRYKFFSLGSEKKNTLTFFFQNFVLFCYCFLSICIFTHAAHSFLACAVLFLACWLLGSGTSSSLSEASTTRRSLRRLRSHRRTAYFSPPSPSRRSGPYGSG